MASFYNAERIQAGWRFFVLWMVMTLLGLGIGAAIEFFLFKEINGNIAVFFAAIMQAWTLNRHVSVYIPWATVTAAGWWIASLVAWFVFSMMPIPNLAIRLAIIALVAGLLAGSLQYFLIKEWLPIGIWWVAIAALNWLSFGLIPAIVLTIILSKEAVSLEGRIFEASEIVPEAEPQKV